MVLVAIYKFYIYIKQLYINKNIYKTYFRFLYGV